MPIKTGKLNESSDYSEFKSKCQNNSTYKKLASICKKYGYELAATCYVESYKSGNKIVNLSIMHPPARSFKPKISYSHRLGFRLETYGAVIDSREFDEYATAINNANKLVKEMEKVDLNTLYQLDREE